MGDTLIELLVSVAILGIASVAVIGSVLMGLTASSITAGNGNNQNTLRNWAEQIEAMPYVDCATTSNYVDAATHPGTTTSITQVRYWDGTSTSPVTFTGTCPTPDKGLQQITLHAYSPAVATEEAQLDLVIVKRKGCASGC